MAGDANGRPIPEVLSGLLAYPYGTPGIVAHFTEKPCVLMYLGVLHYLYVYVLKYIYIYIYILCIWLPTLR